MSADIPPPLRPGQVEPRADANSEPVVGHGFGEYALAFFLGVSGFAYMGALQVAPSDTDRIAILIYPPWVRAHTIRTEVAALDLPFRDIRWKGRLIVVDLADTTPLTRNQLSGWYHGSAVRIAGDIWPDCAPIED